MASTEPAKGHAEKKKDLSRAHDRDAISRARDKKFSACPFAVSVGQRSECPKEVDELDDVSDFISKRQRITLRLLYAIAIPSVVCLSVVCDVGAPYSGG